MRELKLVREIQRREAARANGRHVLNPVHQSLLAKWVNQDNEHMALPEDTDNAALCQDVTGAFFFMVGASSLGGGDTLA